MGQEAAFIRTAYKQLAAHDESRVLLAAREREREKTLLHRRGSLHPLFLSTAQHSTAPKRNTTTHWRVCAYAERERERKVSFFLSSSSIFRSGVSLFVCVHRDWSGVECSPAASASSVAITVQTSLRLVAGLVRSLALLFTDLFQFFKFPFASNFLFFCCPVESRLCFCFLNLILFKNKNKNVSASFKFHNSIFAAVFFWHCHHLNKK